jgi:hypothetical protein
MSSYERTATCSFTKSAGKTPVSLGAFLEVGAAENFFRRIPVTPDAGAPGQRRRKSR